MTYKILSNSYEKRGQISRAVESLQDAIAGLQTLYDPNEEQGVIASAYSALALTYLTHRSELTSAEDQAFLNLQRALEADPDFPDTYVGLSILHGNKETKFYDPQKAIEYCERHLALAPPMTRSEK